MGWRLPIALLCWVSLLGCEVKLDEKSFRRNAEKAYQEASPGWTIAKREIDATVFMRGDQLDRLPVARMFADYQASKQPGSDFLAAWGAQKKAEVDARRKTLEQSEDTVVPILKAGSWIRVQDLGAIGPKHLQDKIRPWRKEIASDLFVVLGVPEEKLGFRFASFDEVGSSKKGSDDWLKAAVQNLDRSIGTSTGAEMKSGDRLAVLDMDNKEDISALVLSPAFRARMLDRFGVGELGAAVPIRNVLILFDSSDVLTAKPVRARAHQLYDTQNHPGFRGLLKLDKDGVSILEPAHVGTAPKSP